MDNKIFNIKKSHLLLLSALSVISYSAAAKSDTLVYCSEASPDGFNPQITLSAATGDAGSMTIFNRLVEFKPGTTEIEPALAESWNISDDGKTYIFHLRENVNFQSNKYFTPKRKLNADDVIFTFERQGNPDNKFHLVSGGQYPLFEGSGAKDLINKIDKIDDHTIRFELKEPNATFLSILAMDFASIQSADYAEAALAAGHPERIDLSPLGTGPFILKQYQKDSRILYSAFDDYWKGKPKINQLVFSITPDATLRYAKLIKNECQIMAHPNIPDLKKISENDQVNLLKSSGLNTGYISFNVEKKPLNNPLVRQALTEAVNQKDILEAVYQGQGTAAKNLIPPTLWSYDSQSPEQTYSPEHAKEQLKQAGYPDGFEITLWSLPVKRPYNPNGKQIAELIQSDWEKIGVKVNIVTYEWAEYIKRAIAGEHEAMMIGWTADYGDPDNFFSSLTCAAAQGSYNFSRWCYKPYDDLVLRARTITDQTQRTKLYQQAQQIIHEQAPDLFLAHSSIYDVARKEVRGYTIDPLGKHNFSNVEL